MDENPGKRTVGGGTILLGAMHVNPLGTDSVENVTRHLRRLGVLNPQCLTLTEKVAPTDAEFDALKDQVRESLLQRKRSEAEEIFLVSLRDRLQKEGRVIVDKKKIESIAGQTGTSN